MMMMMMMKRKRDAYYKILGRLLEYATETHSLAAAMFNNQVIFELVGHLKKLPYI
jgi:hypothetical protein